MYKFRILRFLSITLLAMALVGFPTNQASAGGGPFIVTMGNDGSDAAPGDGFCHVAGGGCSLRAAIEESNAFAGANAIAFSLPGTGLHIMSITGTPLPAITDQLTIDGTTPVGCVAPCIVLSGASLTGANNNGLRVYANNNVIQGFIITSWSNYGIVIVGNGNIIQENIIGYLPSVSLPRPNGAGISILGSNNLIGGTLAGDRNIISGNSGDGIVVGNGTGLATNANIIRGNYIGTNAAGASALGNGGNGIFVSQIATNTSIGGTTAAMRNVISANATFGIGLNGGVGTIIRGNFIGTNAAGTGALGNHADGILINFGSRLTQVGGTMSGAGNRIAFNMRNGVNVFNPTTIRNSIRRNSIYNNALLGIDLGSNGITPNDALDPDNGPNGLQNFPVLTSATSATRVMAGQLRSTASRTYSLDFFSSPACDPSHNGEGKIFLGSFNVITNAMGVVNFSHVVTFTFPVGSRITATATDPFGNTSEFSACRVAN